MCLDERIDESVLRWFGHVERMERDRIAKSLCRSVLVVVQWVRLRKRWMDTVSVGYQARKENGPG